MSVFIVTYDWGTYGSGTEAVFSSKEKAEAFVASKKDSYGSYDINEYIVDERK